MQYVVTLNVFMLYQKKRQIKRKQQKTKKRDKNKERDNKKQEETTKQGERTQKTRREECKTDEAFRVTSLIPHSSKSVVLLGLEPTYGRFEY